MTASIWPADSIGSRTAALMLLCLTLASLMPFCFATAGHSRIDRSPSATPSVLPSISDSALDAAALAGDDGVGRLVEQHEHRLDRRHALLVLVAKAHQRVDVDQREIAGAGRDARDGVRRSAGDIGRDRQAFGAEQAAGRGHHERRGGRIDRPVERELDRERRPRLVRGQARSPAPKRTPRKGPASEASRRERMALVRRARIELTSAGDGTSCRAGR